jgi:GcrA cell cycle regulator
MPIHPVPRLSCSALAPAAARCGTNHEQSSPYAPPEADVGATLHRRIPMAWTDARIAQLTRLWRDGVSAGGIAEALGDVSRSAVLGKLDRLQLLRSRKPAAEPRRYDGPLLVARGPSRAQAAQLAGASQGVRRTAAPEPPRSPWREAAFAPLAGTAPRPWLSRDLGECAFPVESGGEGDGDGRQLSCCAPAKLRSAYCPDHHRIVFRSVSPSVAAAEQRCWAQVAERWAA